MLFSSSSSYSSVGLIWATWVWLKIVPLNLTITLPSLRPRAIYSSFLCSKISQRVTTFRLLRLESSFPKQTNYFSLLVIAIVSPFSFDETMMALALMKNSTQLAKSSGSLQIICTLNNNSHCSGICKYTLSMLKASTVISIPTSYWVRGGWFMLKLSEQWIWTSDVKCLGICFIFPRCFKPK